MISNLVYWALVGWCGTPPRPWPWPPPPPGPDPWPWWRNPVLGIIGGIAGGYLATALFGSEGMMLAQSFGALAGGRIVGELGGGLMKRG